MRLLFKCSSTRFISALVVIIVIFSGLTAQAAEPKYVVENFHAALLKVMKSAKKTPVKARYLQLEPIISKAFNLNFMIRVAVGSRWKKASDTEKSSLDAAFKRMSVSTYAFRFSGYSGQSFKTIGILDGPRKTKLVKTHLVRPGDTPVKLTYVMRQFAQDWKIVDVLLDGSISELAVRVSEYRNILRKKGVSALANALNVKANQLVSQ